MEAFQSLLLVQSCSHQACSRPRDEQARLKIGSASRGRSQMSEKTQRFILMPRRGLRDPVDTALVDFGRVAPPRVWILPCGTYSAASILEDQLQPLAMEARSDVGRAVVVQRRVGHVTVDRYAARRREAARASAPNRDNSSMAEVGEIYVVLSGGASNG